MCLSKYTTFQLGGPSPTLYHCQTPQHLVDVVQKCVKENIAFILIGGGSNLVVSDQGLDCHVIRYFSEQPIIERDGDNLNVSASTRLDDLALYAAQEGLGGINNTSGIPGAVGGAVVGNAGAFGDQIGDVTESVELITPQGDIYKKDTSQCGFSYRYSNLKETNDIVSSVRLNLTKADSNDLIKEREGILKLRAQKHPNLKTHPCAGSFFRNIEPTSRAGKRQASGWFLDQVDGKQLRSGGAVIFDKHANIIVKGSHATAEDVYQLSQKMYHLVKDKFDLDLVREVRFVGDFDQKPESIQSIIW